MNNARELDKRWKEELKGFKYNIKHKTNDEKKAYWNEEAENYDTRMFQDNRRIVAVRNVLEAQGYLNKDVSVLEVGCGTGLYAMDLSEYTKSVTAIDFSEKMGEVLLKKAEKSDINNIVFKKMDWLEIDLHKKGLYKAFDIALSALNPSMSSLEALNKLCDVSKGACVIVTFSGEIENNVRKHLENKGILNLGQDVEWSGYVIEILRELGYNPKVVDTKMEWVKEDKEQNAVQRIVKEYAHLNVSNIEDIISSYVKENLTENGTFKEHNVSPLAVIYWEV